MSDIKTFRSNLIGEQYYKIEHGSGLRIYVYPKDMSTTYGVLSVNFGGNVTDYEKNGAKIRLPQGCAHFLEHKLFDNPDGTGADDVFSALGAYVNAYTSNDRTAYIFSATDHVCECLEHLIYFVTNPYFTKKTVDKEMGIIAEEIRGCVDDPYDRCYLGMLEGMYFNDPVKNEICGSEESISDITAETLYKCCEDFYIPSNMVLSVCGNISPQTVVDIVDKTLQTKDSCIPKIKGFDEPPEVKCALVKKEMQIGKPLFCIGVKDCNIPCDTRERYKRNEAINILLHMMFSEAGEFYLEMIESGILSPGFDFGYSSNSRTAYVMMSGESDDPQKLLEKVKERISQCLKNGLDEQDFDREKKCMYASYISDFDTTEDIAFSMNSYAWEGLDLFDYPSIIDSIDLSYVEMLLVEIFKDEYFTLSVIDNRE